MLTSHFWKSGQDARIEIYRLNETRDVLVALSEIRREVANLIIIDWFNVNESLHKIEKYTRFERYQSNGNKKTNIKEPRRSYEPADYCLVS